MPVYAVDVSIGGAARRGIGADEVFDVGQPVPTSSVVFEAAWPEDAARQAVEIADLGGRVVLVGIPGDDQ